MTANKEDHFASLSFNSLYVPEYFLTSERVARSRPGTKPYKEECKLRLALFCGDFSPFCLPYSNNRKFPKKTNVSKFPLRFNTFFSKGTRLPIKGQKLFSERRRKNFSLRPPLTRNLSSCFILHVKGGKILPFGNFISYGRRKEKSN
jgi:hypothetical protein